jgi:ATP-dependent protease HslVU (ClpYQ) peptidase subunit
VSVIVAVRDATRVCMACDSLAVNNSAKMTLATSKMARNGRFIFGASDGPTIQTIRHLARDWWEQKISSTSDFEAWVLMVFLPFLRGALREQRILCTKDGCEELRCNILIASGARFVCIDTAGFAVSTEAAYHAIGSGWYDARSAMWAAPSGMGSEAVARLGVEAAIKHDESCGPPILTLWTGP